MILIYDVIWGINLKKFTYLNLKYFVTSYIFILSMEFIKPFNHYND